MRYIDIWKGGEKESLDNTGDETLHLFWVIITSQIHSSLRSEIAWITTLTYKTDEALSAQPTRIWQWAETYEIPISSPYSAHHFSILL